MLRRMFLCGAAAATASRTAAAIMTVTGLLKPENAGVMLPHEHVMSAFGGAATESPVYDVQRLMAAVVPYLRTVRGLGCRTVADCTAAWFGRNPKLLQTISRQSKINILTNTGYYGAAKDAYVPPHAQRETAEQIAARWIREWREGIGDTGIRPGFVKLGVDLGPLSEIDRKLVRAGALTHLETGLVLAVHTGGNPDAAVAQLGILKEERVPAGAWIWVHANQAEDERALLRAAGEGAWLEFDGLDAESVPRHLELVRLMKRHRLLDRVLLSHDGDSFPYGGRTARGYDALFRLMLPALRKDGFTEAEIAQLTVDNPREAFTVRKR